jgi:hypothetical protein
VALQTITGGMWLPDPLPGILATVQLATGATIDASTELCAGIGLAPKAGAIRKVHFRTGAVSVNAATRLSAAVQTVSATTGDPSGSNYGGSTAGAAGAAPTANAWSSITLGTDATVGSVGDVIAAVIGFNNFVAADSVVISALNSTSNASIDFPYVDAFVGGAWAKSAAQMPCMALEYSDGSFAYMQGWMPVTTVTNQSFASNTAGTDEYALSFQIPFPARLRGVAAMIDGDGDYEVIIYSGTSALETIAVDKDQRAGTVHRFRYFRFPAGQSLSANTTYRLGIRPTTTTAIVLQIHTVNSAALLDQMSGGQDFCLGTRLDQGAWAADTTTQRPMIFLQFDQMDDGASAGAGLLTYRGLEGGTNG